jgi:hypothetical protein
MARSSIKIFFNDKKFLNKYLITKFYSLIPLIAIIQIKIYNYSLVNNIIKNYRSR